jgi:putative lipoprotein
MEKDAPDSGLPNQIEPSMEDPLGKNPWLIFAFILGVLILVGILAYADFSVARIEEPIQAAAFITITEPDEGRLVDTTWAISVKGEAGGLFEGNVIVQALSASGELLAQQATIILAEDAGTGGSGAWVVDLQINVPPGTQGQIRAFSSSPLDGSTAATDSIHVGFGESPGAGDLVKPENHLWSLVALNGKSLLEDTLITLQFENFQAFGSSGCNRYKTSFERSGNSLNFGLVTSTAMECEEPDGILVQESEYYTALERAAVFRVENQQLILFDNSGSQLLVYEAIVMGNIISEMEAELPEDAVVYVQLNDVSLADAEAKPIAEQVISGAIGFPIPYQVKYNPRQIIENHTFAIRVRIEDSEGNLLFITPTVYNMITNDRPSQVDIKVEAVR